VAWRPGFVEMRLEVRLELCNANELLHARLTTQFIKAAREGDVLTILGAWRPSTSRSPFAETEIHDQNGDLIATGTGTFRYLKGEEAAD